MGYNLKIGISSVLTLYLHKHVWTRMRELCIIEIGSFQTPQDDDSGGIQLYW